MLVQCTRKGCFQQTHAQLDRKTGEVICLECGEPIFNVSEYTKRTLISIGQVLRTSERKAFQIHCPTCRGKRSVELLDGGKNGAKCSDCGTELRISAAVLHAMSVMGKDKDE